MEDVGPEYPMLLALFGGERMGDHILQPSLMRNPSVSARTAGEDGAPG
jgi:hypothetical protein